MTEKENKMLKNLIALQGMCDIEEAMLIADDLMVNYIGSEAILREYFNIIERDKR